MRNPLRILLDLLCLSYSGNENVYLRISTTLETLSFHFHGYNAKKTMMTTQITLFTLCLKAFTHFF